jgi:hypothetical protein
MHHRSFGLKLSFGTLALVYAMGCFTVEGKDPQPSERRTEYTSSGYTVDGCQENLDKLAGAHVEMTMHSGSPMLWLSLGLIPAYVCKGVVETPSSVGAK